MKNLLQNCFPFRPIARGPRGYPLAPPPGDGSYLATKVNDSCLATIAARRHVNHMLLFSEDIPETRRVGVGVGEGGAEVMLGVITTSPAALDSDWF